VRIGESVGRRRDELADLGRDFDITAARLTLLMEGQRRLLHDVSHEVRSPLARLQTFSALTALYLSLLDSSPPKRLLDSHVSGAAVAEGEDNSAHVHRRISGSRTPLQAANVTMSTDAEQVARKLSVARVLDSMRAAESATRPATRMPDVTTETDQSLV
jgi:signal transduction histidine kinase